ncbi:hypothetical protein RJ639_020076 [Escallonia herrerae]|uniref:Translation elongation factor KOW-like domain-containing protein n=1 Tax=Escallonia herrerae TaxID=1293975 RepID=A0AA89AJC4_9ASTE|nr:hypothetical protein RJ639_020076 [Escallonia herrerae]
MRLLTRLLARTLYSPAPSSPSPSPSSHRRHSVLVSRSLQSQPDIRRPESARLGVLASPWSASQLRRFRIRGADVSSPRLTRPHIHNHVPIAKQNDDTCAVFYEDAVDMSVRPGNVIQRKGKTYQVVKSQHTTQGRGGAAIQQQSRSCQKIKALRKQIEQKDHYGIRNVVNKKKGKVWYKIHDICMVTLILGCTSVPRAKVKRAARRLEFTIADGGEKVRVYKRAARRLEFTKFTKGKNVQLLTQCHPRINGRLMSIREDPGEKVRGAKVRGKVKLKVFNWQWKQNWFMVRYWMMEGPLIHINGPGIIYDAASHMSSKVATIMGTGH